MVGEESATILTKIGNLLKDMDTQSKTGDILLYAELDSNMVSVAIFEDAQGSVLYRRFEGSSLGDLLLDLWENQAEEERWGELEYILRGESFEVDYKYPEDIDRTEERLDRRKRIVAQHFGAKPIIYPVWPPNDDPDIYDLKDGIVAP